MIPVLGAPIIKNPQWITRLYYSIDYPVNNFIIINNNGTGEIYNQLEALKSINHSYVNNLHIVHLPGNIGVGGAWNLIIKSMLMSPYWLITNDDIAFPSGMLEQFHKKAISSDYGMIHGQLGDFNNGAFDLFLIKDWVIQKFGLFDENLYPAYCEDADYIMRMANDKNIITSLNTKYLHGTGMSDEYYTHGSQTKKSSSALSARLSDINEINFEYMTDKWGIGWRMTDPYKFPYNIPEIPLTYTSFDLGYARRKFIEI